MITLSSHFRWANLTFVQRASRSDTALDVSTAMRRARQMLEDRRASVDTNPATGMVKFEGVTPTLGSVAFGTIGSGELHIERSGDQITATADSSLLPAILATAASLTLFLVRIGFSLALVVSLLALTAWGIWLNDVVAVRRLVQAALSLNNPGADDDIDQTGGVV